MRGVTTRHMHAPTLRVVAVVVVRLWDPIDGVDTMKIWRCPSLRDIVIRRSPSPRASLVAIVPLLAYCHVRVVFLDEAGRVYPFPCRPPTSRHHHHRKLQCLRDTVLESREHEQTWIGRKMVDFEVTSGEGE